MLSKAVQDAINDQVRHEFYSAHLYLSMASYFEYNNLPGMAKWNACSRKKKLRTPPSFSIM